MKRNFSLRARLTAIILLPLMTIAIGLGFWQLRNAQRTATDVFDNALLSAALAVANDVAISGGDALSLRTRDILASTSGGQVFYHVYAPDGVIVAGYATPPVGIPTSATEAAGPITFEASYLGQRVHGVRLQNRTEVDGFAGIFTTTVWQGIDVRAAFVRDLILRTFIAISAMIASLGMIVWFGVRVGLRPLLDLEQAIGQRSERELSPIQRAVPQEVSGIVTTLNRLLGQVSRSMSAQSDFIANAAHQLRNPIAGVLALAEAVTNAPDAKAAQRRAADLLQAARETSHLTQKLLLLERAESLSPQSTHERLHLNEVLPDWVQSLRGGIPDRVRLELTLPAHTPPIFGDPTMLREAVANLVHNANLHGGKGMTRIDIGVEVQNGQVSLYVADNGQGLAESDIPKALERFARLSETSTNGLGLSIVEAIAKSHGSRVRLSRCDPGLRVEFLLPGSEGA